MKHVLKIANSDNLDFIPSKSVQLIVTSPPYPMIQMWDNLFINLNPEIENDLSSGNGKKAFKKMHEILNNTWEECDRVLADNSFICINVGDATRTINKDFQMYPNHNAIIDFFFSKGYHILPDIHWRKPSNAPNKFMGSGMYPAGAYVTYEHEYILIFRKGGKRIFKGEDREQRRESAYFWEERNSWFSDLWEIKGTSQSMPALSNNRKKNASFPLEIPYRLVSMYSKKADTVLDPFCGMGTTNFACMLSERNSIGVDIDSDMIDLAFKNLNTLHIDEINQIIKKRIEKHIHFIESLDAEEKQRCYDNENHSFKVKTRQERQIHIKILKSIVANPDNKSILCYYE